MRSALLDGVDRMRSATTAAQTCEDMTVLASTLYWEQVCKIRTRLGQRSHQSAGDCTALFRGLLLRHLFYQYARQIFPQLSGMLDVYGTWKWYHLHYGMDEQGRVQGVVTSDEEDNDKDKDKDKDGDEQGGQTRFESKRRLKWFMDQIAQGKHDHAFTCMARHTSSATNLDLGCDGMKHVQKLFTEIWALYKMDFPDTSAPNSALPSTELQMPVSSAGEYTPAHVKASNSIESEEEYHAKLSAYQEQCRKATENSTRDHIELRIAFVTESDPTTMGRKLDRVSFMREPGRKLFIYDSLVQDPLNWNKLRKENEAILPHRSQSEHDLSASWAGKPGHTEHNEGHIPLLQDRAATRSALRGHCGSHRAGGIR